MKPEVDPSLERVVEGGADILRIAEASVLLVVDDLIKVELWRHPVWALCRALAALGFGAIQLVGARDCEDELAHLMRGAMFAQRPQLGSLGGPTGEDPPFDVVLHLGTDAATRRRCASLAHTTGMPFRAFSWGASWLAMQSETSEEDARATGQVPRPAELEALPPVSRVVAGLALQEAIILAGGLADAVEPDPLVFFDAASDTRSADGELSDWSDVWIEDAVLEVVGAGGIGTHLLESLAPLLGDGCELRIFDFDTVGPENLAVQSAFALEDVGRSKAEVMADKLTFLSDPVVAIDAFVMRYEDRPSDLSIPSLRVVCPDTFAARAHANDCSIRDNVPLVEAGSSPHAGQQRTYLPGVSACLAHRIPDLARRVAGERDRASCAQEHAITLPGTNTVSGGLLALEALRALDPRRLGPPSTGTIVYDTRFSQRFGIVSPRPPCSH
jgi:molybdopterin/thiamine biosynthesis adenylyltransferase